MKRKQTVKRVGRKQLVGNLIPLGAREVGLVALGKRGKALRLSADSYVIPEEFGVFPAVNWRNGKPTFYRVLVRLRSKKCANSVQSRRAKKTV